MKRGRFFRFPWNFDIPFPLDKYPVRARVFLQLHPMKIAFIGQKGIPALYGGVERHVEELSVHLVRRGHDVTVYTRPYFTHPSRKSFRGVKLVSLPSLHTKHFDAITHTLLSTMHAIRNGFDIIHFHGVGPSLLSFLPKLFGSKAKVIATFHSIDRKHKKWGAFARYFLWLGEWASVSFPDQTISVSRTIREYCRLCFHKETVYIPNGVTESLPRNQRASLIRQRFGLMTDQYILAVSRLIPHKGIHYLIEAFRKLDTKKNLVIVGDACYTDDYVRKLKELAGNDPRIIFTGFQKGKMLAELLSNAYLFVLPSEAEGLPIALLEAASFGRCVLASNIPENIEVVRANGQVIGYTFRNKDTKDLTTKLRALMKTPRTIRHRGALARKVVNDAFNWRSITRDIETLYAAA
jgi:glycosyltransferase involved in cell wall biosynthesis